MENTEATLAVTGTTEDRDGKKAWSNPSNITTEAGNTACNIGATTYSDWLRASNFGFQIPVGSTINGVVVEINNSALGISDSALYLVGSDGVNMGDNKASSNIWGITASTATYGSSSDTWGATLSYAKINHSDFGIRLSAFNGSPSLSLIHI